MNEHSNIKTPIKSMAFKQPQTINKQFFNQTPNMLDCLRLYLSMEYFNVQLLEQESHLKVLSDRTAQLERTIPKKPELAVESDKKKKNRRLANDIQREFECPYASCGRSYGSEISLNLHIRIKHNGGSKIDRENLAKEMMAAKLRGQEPPKSNIQLPPGFLKQFCETYQEFLRKEESDLNQHLSEQKIEATIQQKNLKN